MKLLIFDNQTYSDKENAGKKLLECCKELKSMEEKEIGEYRGFKMKLAFNSFSKNFQLTLKNKYHYMVELGTDTLKEKLKTVDKEKLSEILQIDNYTLEDIIKSLEKPLLDPRDELVKPILKSDIMTIDNLKEGMVLEGTVRNVVDFGAFVDIGLKNDGLIHISNLSNTYVKHPSDILAVGDIIKCKVLEINKEKKKVALTLKDF